MAFAIIIKLAEREGGRREAERRLLTRAVKAVSRLALLRTLFCLCKSVWVCVGVGVDV